MTLFGAALAHGLYDLRVVRPGLYCSIREPRCAGERPDAGQPLSFRPSSGLAHQAADLLLVADVVKYLAEMTGQAVGAAGRLKKPHGGA